MKNKENRAKLRKIESAGTENAGKGLASMGSSAPSEPPLATCLSEVSDVMQTLLKLKR